VRFAYPSVILIGIIACADAPPRPPAPRPTNGPRHEVVIHEPERLTSVATGDVDALGRPVRVACVVCHSQRRPERLPASTKELDEFHQGLAFAHGTLACASCHVVGEQDTLRLADGSTIAMRDALTLCAQCHGPQYRDYQHGAHGGMSGHWDLAAGPRLRNHCVDCHDPHAPAYQPSVPVLVPRDRGLVRARGGH
jgi:formate-dependent nitrite reductase cytochrome c552 subunit